ncbi:uncharacterized protein BYT42DRAFT_605547 [Radiomyces spectabilis]|uniref:uncharacterized protein n=1 Tax=Radiomyces spectabilis TaxID=64574 RepID=UPI0022207F5A|nr:uncharacterized protein BYT42DRAFT_605547 [Radiomyces spectabilis]KAI8378010.1 hypothetical protein BYT42DRAFT_605547 [Radiomyces spectabilis]
MQPSHRTRSFDPARSVTATPTIDPAAVDWHDFAARQSKNRTDKGTTPAPAPPPTRFSRARTTHTTPTTRHYRPSSAQGRYDSSNPKPPIHTEWSIAKKLTCMPDPPLCFCGKPASRRRTPEFGPILDCHYFTPCNKLSESQRQTDTDQPPPPKSRSNICGFHVHQRPWDEFRQRLRDGNDIDPCDSELDICPSFNYTFCVIFRANNPYKKTTPPPPKCFCNMPVILEEGSNKHEKRLYFTCRHLNIDGARPKCSWFLWAEDVPFYVPKYPLHALPISKPTPPSHSRPPSNTTDINAIVNTASPQLRRLSIREEEQSSTSPPSMEPSTPTSSSSASPSNSITSSSHPPSIPNSIDQPITENKPTPVEEILDVTQAENVIPATEPSPALAAKPLASEKRLSMSYSNLPSTTISPSNLTGDKDHHVFHHTRQNTSPLSPKKETLYSRPTSFDQRKSVSEPGNDKGEFIRLLSMANLPRNVTLNEPKWGNNYSYDQFIYGQKPHESPTMAIRSNGYLLPSAVLQNTLGKPGNKLLLEHQGNAMRNPSPPRCASSEDHDAEVKTLVQKVKDLEQLCEQLEENTSRATKDYEYMLTTKQKLDDICRRKTALAELMETEVQQLRSRQKQMDDKLSEEIDLRKSCQKKVVELDDFVNHMLLKQDELSEENEQCKEKLAYKDSKCRVCFQENIEFALIPCYHCAYCKDCAEKLKECAVCRTPKFTVQRIYLP